MLEARGKPLSLFFTAQHLLGRVKKSYKGLTMLKNITGTLSTIFEGIELLTEKSVAIAGDTLDIVGEEVSVTLESSQAIRSDKLALAKAEAEYDVKKAKMKLEGKLSALQRLADKSNNTK